MNESEKYSMQLGMENDLLLVSMGGVSKKDPLIKRLMQLPTLSKSLIQELMLGATASEPIGELRRKLHLHDS